MTPQELYKIEDFLEIYPISRATLYRQKKAGRIKLTKVGRSSFISRADAQAWAETLPKE